LQAKLPERLTVYVNPSMLAATHSCQSFFSAQ
jgi:hypothetical protein